MASLIQVRDLLALRGRMEATQISHTLHAPQPMIDAMLNQLEIMGKRYVSRKKRTAAFQAAVKVVQKVKPACANGGPCVSLRRVAT